MRTLHCKPQVALVGLQCVVEIFHFAVHAGQYVQIAMRQLVGIGAVSLLHQVNRLVHIVDAPLAVALEEYVLPHCNQRLGMIEVVVRLYSQVEQLLQPLGLYVLMPGEFAGFAERVQHAQLFFAVGLYLLIV